MSATIDMAGKKCGQLTVISYAGSVSSRATWNCLCDCGNSKRIDGKSLRSGNTKSCGSCGHGLTYTRVYIIYSMMKQRCNNPKHEAFLKYGGRGIKVCEAWGDVVQFHKDMGDPPSSEHTLDRIDNNKGYSADNCRWATKSQQSQNRRTYINHNQKLADKDVLEIRASKLSSKELSGVYNVSSSSIRHASNGTTFKHLM